MSISFKSGLFGIEQSDGASPFQQDSGPLRSFQRESPTWDAETEQWSISCVLGECGMAASVADG